MASVSGTGDSVAVEDGSRKRDWGTRLVAFSNRIQLTYWLMMAGSRVASVLPLRLTYTVASLIGDLTFYLWRTKHDAALANMRHVLGPSASDRHVWRTARASYRNYLKYVVDFLRFSSMTVEDVRRATSVVGLEHLDRALATGKGVIFATVHFGHFDLGAVVLALRGYPVNVVVDTFDPPKLNEAIQRQRTEKGVNIIPIEVAGRRVLRALRQNQILGLVIDRPLPGEGVQVNFCDGPVEVPAGAGTLALKTGAVVVTGYMVRESDNTFFGEVSPHITVEPSGELARDVEAITQRIMSNLEESIKQYPEQWYMFRRMWQDRGLQPGTAN